MLNLIEILLSISLLLSLAGYFISHKAVDINEPLDKDVDSDTENKNNSNETSNNTSEKLDFTKECGFSLDYCIKYLTVNNQSIPIELKGFDITLNGVKVASLSDLMQTIVYLEVYKDTILVVSEGASSNFKIFDINGQIITDLHKFDSAGKGHTDLNFYFDTYDMFKYDYAWVQDIFKIENDKIIVYEIITCKEPYVPGESPKWVHKKSAAYEIQYLGNNKFANPVRISTKEEAIKKLCN